MRTEDYKRLTTEELLVHLKVEQENWTAYNPELLDVISLRMKEESDEKKTLKKNFDYSFWEVIRGWSWGIGFLLLIGVIAWSIITFSVNPDTIKNISVNKVLESGYFEKVTKDGIEPTLFRIKQ